MQYFRDMLNETYTTNNKQDGKPPSSAKRIQQHKNIHDYLTPEEERNSSPPPTLKTEQMHGCNTVSTKERTHGSNSCLIKN
jgi:hypothetical protein